MTRQLLNGVLGGLAVLAGLYAVGLTWLLVGGPRADGPPAIVLVAAWVLSLVAGVLVVRRLSRPVVVSTDVRRP
jgi:hypothetical protein